MLSSTLVALSTLAMGTAAAAVAAVAAPPAPAPSSLVIPENALTGVQLGGFTLGEAVPLTKRATEGIHFVNCEGGSLNLKYSLEIFCADDSNCNHIAASTDQCFLSTAGLFTWEGRTNQGCGFPSGVPFTYTLPSDAQSKADFSRVGSGSNRFKSYNIFKDNKHEMYKDGNGASCKSIYYALPA